MSSSSGSMFGSSSIGAIGSTASSTSINGVQSPLLVDNTTNLESEIYPVLLKTEATIGVVLSVFGLFVVVSLFRIARHSNIKYIHLKVPMSFMAWLCLFMALVIRAATSTQLVTVSRDLLHTATVLEEIFLFLEWLFWSGIVRSFMINSKRDGRPKNLLAKGTTALAAVAFSIVAFVGLIIVDVQNLCFKVGLCTSHFMVAAFGATLLIVVVTILFTICLGSKIWVANDMQVLRKCLIRVIPALVAGFLYSFAFLYCDNTGKPEPDFSSVERSLVEGLPPNVIPHDMEDLAEYVTARFCFPMAIIFSGLLLIFQLVMKDIEFSGFSKSDRRSFVPINADMQIQGDVERGHSTSDNRRFSSMEPSPSRTKEAHYPSRSQNNNSGDSRSKSHHGTSERAKDTLPAASPTQQPHTPPRKHKKGWFSKHFGNNSDSDDGGQYDNTES